MQMTYYVKGFVLCWDFLSWGLQKAVEVGRSGLCICPAPPLSPVLQISARLLKIEGAQVQLRHAQLWIVVLHLDAPWLNEALVSRKPSSAQINPSC